MPNILTTPKQMQTISPLSQGSLSLQSSNGIKAASPVGVNNSISNTLSTKNVSPQQTATSPNFNLNSPTTPSLSSLMGIQTSTPSTPAAGSSTTPLASLGIGGASTFGSNPAPFQPLSASLTQQPTIPVAGSNASPAVSNSGSSQPFGGSYPPSQSSTASQPVYSSSGGAIIPQNGQSPLPQPASALPTISQYGQGTPQEMAASQSPSSLVGNLIGQSQTTLSAQQQTAQQQISQNQATIQAAQQEAEALTAGGFSGTAAGYTGRLAQLSQIVQNAQANINAAQQNLSTYTGQAQNALGTGLSASTNYISSPYGQPIYNPLTSQSVSGGTSGNNSGSLGTSSVQSLAEQVINGTMPYATAVQSLGYMGSAGEQMLNGAISSASPNFNFAQAIQNAPIQGTIGPQSQLATSMIQNLQTTLQNAPQLQQTGYPALNAIDALVNNMGFGGSQAQQESQALTDSVNEARTSVSNALGTAYNTTPTAFTSLVNSWFPDNPTNAQVQAGLQEFNTMMSARTQSFASPGTASLPGNSSNSQTVSAGGMNFVNQNGQWVAQ